MRRFPVLFAVALLAFAVALATAGCRLLDDGDPATLPYAFGARRVAPDTVAVHVATTQGYCCRELVATGIAENDTFRIDIVGPWENPDRACPAMCVPVPIGTGYMFVALPSAHYVAFSYDGNMQVFRVSLSGATVKAAEIDHRGSRFIARTTAAEFRDFPTEPRAD